MKTFLASMASLIIGVSMSGVALIDWLSGVSVTQLTSIPMVLAVMFSAVGIGYLACCIVGRAFHSLTKTKRA